MRPRPRHLRLVVPEPLPECPLCERPTRRDVHDELGMCTACHDGIRDAAERVTASLGARLGRRLPPVVEHE